MKHTSIVDQHINSPNAQFDNKLIRLLDASIICDINNHRRKHAQTVWKLLFELLNGLFGICLRATTHEDVVGFVGGGVESFDGFVADACVACGVLNE